jgi:hypothetical protein
MPRIAANGKKHRPWLHLQTRASSYIGIRKVLRIEPFDIFRR